MSDQLEVTEHSEYSTVNNKLTLTPSTSNPSGISSIQTSNKEKSSKQVKHILFPFSWPEIFYSKIIALLTKHDLVVKKFIKALEEDKKYDIAQLGNYYKPYINNLHVNGGCLYFNDRLVIPVYLRTTMLHRLHEAHPAHFAMKIWQPSTSGGLKSIEKSKFME